jgi:hypothetical protein
MASRSSPSTSQENASRINDRMSMTISASHPSTAPLLTNVVRRWDEPPRRARGVPVCAREP